MAKIINTASMDLSQMSAFEKQQVYNGLDCAITHEVNSVLDEKLDSVDREIYDFEMELRGPALEMQLNGIRVDLQKRQDLIEQLTKDMEQVRRVLDRYAYALWSKGLNPNSPKQVQALLYDHLGYKEIKNPKTQRRTTDEKALNKLRLHFYAEPIVNAILKFRDLDKLRGTLKSGVHKDGRMRAAFKVAGTETGRWASSKDDFGLGTNFQNQTDRTKRIFVADPGMEMAYIDLEQAESRVVAYLSQDENYIAACEAGDVHTAVTKMIWPDLPWTGDPAKDKEVAERPFYKDKSYRYMTKRAGHGTNYWGKPPTIAREMNAAVDIIERFQARYFKAFPGLEKWHHQVAKDLQLHGCITTPLGRRRYFFGRLNDDATIREAIAYAPQSTIADLLNKAMLRLWWIAPRYGIQFLAQVHDAVLIQYPEGRRDEVLSAAIKEMEVPIKVGDYTMVVPCEAEWGWNWAPASPDNPDGLKAWSENDERQRTEQPTVSFLDCKVPGVH